MKSWPKRTRGHRYPPQLLRAAALSATVLSRLATAQPAIYESEPNDSPPDANPIAGPVTILGSMSPGDQDGYRWTVSDVDAQKRWTLELKGIPGALTIVEVIRLEYADNGVDVTRRKTLFTLGSRDGIRPALVEDLIFEPGDYLLGLARAGGNSGGFRPPADSIRFDPDGRGEPANADAAASGYRLAIRAGAKLHAGQSGEYPTRESARKLRAGSETAALMLTGTSWFKFEIDPQQSTQRWELRGQIPVGGSAGTFLRDAAGNPLSEQPVDARGKFAYRDLGLAEGTYYLEIRGRQGGEIRAITLASVGQRIAGAEAEPNNTWTLANRADLSRPITGRMGEPGDRDYFQFELDPVTADQALTLSLETGADQQMQLCLYDAGYTQLQCRSGKGVVELPDLVLTAGTWRLAAERGPAGAEYRISLTAQGPIKAGTEAEPNDTPRDAVAIPSRNRIKGRFAGREDDYYRFTVTDEPQLWRFQVIGDGIHELAYYDGAGIQNQNYRVPAGQRRVRLENVFLLPGIHHIRVSGLADGAYTLLARPLGPPDPNGEFEPNDDVSRMQGLRIGQTRTGLLPDLADRDNYRFHLANWDRIRLTIEAPVDGEILAQLYWDNNSFKQFNLPQPGQKVVLEGLFPPGDYRLLLQPKTPSDAQYRLGLERLARYGCATDCEPNDNLDFANPLPQSGVVEGIANEWRDPDWYALPLFDQDTEVTLDSTQRHDLAVVERGYAPRNLVSWDADAALWRGTVPAGVQSYLHVKARSNTPYRLDVRFSGSTPAPAGPVLPPPTLSLDFPVAEVSAYRTYGQRLEGTLKLENSSPTALEVTLDASTSDHRWRAHLDQRSALIPPKGAVEVGVRVTVPVDAWADWPVRVSVRAAGAGGQSETAVDLVAGRDAKAVNPEHSWPLPEALRGGFNAAWAALGGEWTGGLDSVTGTGFDYLNDGMAVEQQGLQLRGGTEVQTIDYVVRLAGEEPVDVAGLALNLLGMSGAPRYLRNIDFALSLDGETFTPAATGELSPIEAEQAVVLAQPTPARYARLQLKHAFDGGAKPALTLGELKVITAPGSDLSGGRGYNLAEPALGGHVVWANPPISASDWGGGLLVDDQKWYSLRLKPGQAQEFVLGFHHARAAQISRIEWFNAAGAASDRRFRRVALAVSTDSPLGPWTEVGDWDLGTSGAPAEGLFAEFSLAQPTWARYLKFSAVGGAVTGGADSPSLVRVWERPTGGNYRSVLTEWGFASQSAIYEQLHPLQVDPPFEPAGHDSRDRAAALAFDRSVGGQVVLGKHVHWYRLQVPEGDNLLRFTMTGDPTVRTVLHLENRAGEPVPLRVIASASSPRTQVAEAIAEAGGEYYLRIEEPPRNVVFLWDTSASVGAYLPVIYNSLIAYAEDLVPGRDAANLIPFGGKLLLRDWYGEPFILQTVLNDYPRKESSSEAEGTLADASTALAPREGTKAIVMVTDAATNRYPGVWDRFRSVHPRVFGLGVGSQGALGRNPAREQDLMQDWSRVNGGHYAHLLSEGEMEVAFDRASTLLRRPAGYTLEVAGSFREDPGPGSLRLVPAAGESATAGAVELILDASGSMLKRLAGKRRIAIAREVLADAVTTYIPAGTPVALRVFGHREPGACRSDLEIPLKPLKPEAAVRVIQGIEAMNLAKTPIAASLAKVESDLGSIEGPKVVVLVTDGEETCDGDASQVIRTLTERGIGVTLNIVGFAIDDAGLASQFEQWAQAGGGRYFSANDQAGLQESVRTALRTAYSVYDSAGTLVGEGTVGGEPLSLPQGDYRVVVAGSPPRVFERVQVSGGEALELTLDAARLRPGTGS